MNAREQYTQAYFILRLARRRGWMSVITGDLLRQAGIRPDIAHKAKLSLDMQRIHS
jgi:hypothetical protein